MRRAGLALLLLAGCVSSISPVTDAGSDGPRPSACFVPDGGVLAVRPVAPVAGCALGARDGGLMELGSLGLALQGGLLSIPDAPEGVALPVVFVFHGAGSTGAAARTYGLEAPADGGAIFVYPDAVRGTWDVGGTSADARRVELALRRLSETRCIDPDRVFITGFSAGAVFTLYLGCNVPTAFRAMAVVAGSDRRFDTSCCHGAISALFIHGTADDTIPILDGELARNRTLGRDACSFTPESAGSTCETHDCPAPWAVEFCTWSGGHAVPDWAGAEMWRFFGSLPALE
jgi:poly(3-hydroxybutyrate) depolymerase